MKFNTAYINRPLPKKEALSQKDNVDRVGYVSTEKQVKAMTQAGIVLKHARDMAYDTMDPKAVPPVDPTRRPGLDMADISLYARNAAGSLELQRLTQAEFKAKQEQEAKKASETPSPKP